MDRAHCIARLYFEVYFLEYVKYAVQACAEVYYAVKYVRHPLIPA